MTQLKIGLVLSGGGAKGAYQVGVLRALHEMGAEVGAVAGASIGALNAAVLACAPAFRVGVDRMEELWLTLAKESPLDPHYPAYLKLLLAGGLMLSGQAYLVRLLALAQSLGIKLPAAANILDEGLMSDDPIRQQMNRYLDINTLATGLPLYISVFKSQGAVRDILATVVAEIGLKDTPESEFLHIQSLPHTEQKQALLASAAIPLLFAPKEINNSPYSDGGMGGWQKMQGNTPFTPLLKAGFKSVIVTHLSDGSLWSRQDFPEATILEIRPQSPIERSGGVKDLLGFDTRKIPSWIEQGYRDTMHCVGRVMNAVQSRQELRQSEIEQAESEKQITAAERKLAETMSILRSLK